MLNRLKSKLKNDDNKILLTNFLSLSSVQAANYILPLITLPYLVRVLGTDKFGLLVFAQSFIQYFIIFTDYGFNLSAVREISIHRHNKDKIEEVVSSVFTVKALLLIFSLIIIVAIVFFFDKFSKDSSVYLLTSLSILGQTLFPIWFFQGIERMKYISVLNITSKAIFAVSIFIFIRDPSHYIYVPLLNSLGFLVSGTIGFYILIANFKLRIKIVPIKQIIYTFIDGFRFFLSRFSAQGHTSINTFLIGMFFSNTLVTYYYTADKIIHLVISFLEPVTQTLYPHFSKKFKPAFFRKCFFSIVIVSLISSAVIYLAGDFLSIIIYRQLVSTFIHILNYLVILLPVSSIYVFLGVPFLLALGFRKDFNNSMIYGFVLHLILLLVYFAFFEAQIVHFVLVVILSRLFIMCLRFYYIYKRKIAKYFVP